MATQLIDMNTIEAGWRSVLKEEFEKDYFKSLVEFVQQEMESQTIYPPQDEIFAAFNYTPFEELNVVLLGQDPYHGAGQAHGLCFSVAEGVKQPPSLKNIFKELESDVGTTIPKSGCLTKWAKQGVLLLNATLTVRAKTAGSHQKKGWEEFTDQVIRTISDQKSGVVFILWGRYAQDKEQLIDASKHHVLKAAHPSPFSAKNGFFGCKHFSQTNEFLKKQNKKEIDWQIED